MSKIIHRPYVERVMNPQTPDDWVLSINQAGTPANKQLINMNILNQNIRLAIKDLIEAECRRSVNEKAYIDDKEFKEMFAKQNLKEEQEFDNFLRNRDEVSVAHQVNMLSSTLSRAEFADRISARESVLNAYQENIEWLDDYEQTLKLEQKNNAEKFIVTMENLTDARIASARMTPVTLSNNEIAPDVVEAAIRDVNKHEKTPAHIFQYTPALDSLAPLRHEKAIALLNHSDVPTPPPPPALPEINEKELKPISDRAAIHFCMMNEIKTMGKMLEKCKTPIQDMNKGMVQILNENKVVFDTAPAILQEVKEDFYLEAMNKSKLMQLENEKKFQVALYTEQMEFQKKESKEYKNAYGNMPKPKG